MAIGRGGGQFEVEMSRDSGIVVGDYLEKPSLNSSYFGTVIQILKDPAQPFETVIFAAPVNLYDLRWVLVARNVTLLK